MSVVNEPEYSWSPDKMVEVFLNEPDDFLKVRETLLYQSMITELEVI